SGDGARIWRHGIAHMAAAASEIQHARARRQPGPRDLRDLREIGAGRMHRARDIVAGARTELPIVQGLTAGGGWRLGGRHFLVLGCWSRDERASQCLAWAVKPVPEPILSWYPLLPCK